MNIIRQFNIEQLTSLPNLGNEIPNSEGSMTFIDAIKGNIITFYADIDYTKLLKFAYSYHLENFSDVVIPIQKESLVFNVLLTGKANHMGREYGRKQLYMIASFEELNFANLATYRSYIHIPPTLCKKPIEDISIPFRLNYEKLSSKRIISNHLRNAKYIECFMCIRCKKEPRVIIYCPPEDLIYDEETEFYACSSGCASVHLHEKLKNVGEVRAQLIFLTYRLFRPSLCDHPNYCAPEHYEAAGNPTFSVSMLTLPIYTYITYAPVREMR